MNRTPPRAASEPARKPAYPALAATVVFLATVAEYRTVARADDWPALGLSQSRARVSGEQSGDVFAAGRWSYTLPATDDSVYRALIASPAVADGFVIIGGSDRHIRALRERDGKLLWTFAMGAVAQASPAIAEGTVFAASVDRQLYALRIDTGALSWKRDIGGLAYSSPVTVEGSVFIAAGNPAPRVLRMNAATGGIEWSAGEGVLEQAAHASVAVSGGHVLVAEMDGNLHAFALATGAHEWSYHTGGTMNLSSPLVVGDRVYVLPGGDNQRLFAIDVATGVPVAGWPIDLDFPDDVLAGKRLSQARVVSSPAGGGEPPAGGVEAGRTSARGRIVFEVRLDEQVDTNLDGLADTWVIRELTVGVDPASARVAWLHPNGRRVTSDPNQIPTYGLCPTPALFGSLLGAPRGGTWVATTSTVEPRVRVLEVATGTERWSAALSASTRGSPVMANGRLFVGTDAGVVHAFLSAANQPPEPPTHGFFPSSGQAIDPVGVRFRWTGAFDAEAGALTYQLRFDSDGEILRSFAGRVTTSPEQVSAQAGQALAADRDYVYAIRSRDRRGAWSAWSQPQRFRTVTSPPVSIGGRTFASLTDALAAARSGDVIRLGTGTYHPSSRIALPGGVSLAGSGPHLTVIEARGLEAGIAVDSTSNEKTRILGLTVSHGGTGIEVRDAHDVELRNVILRDNRDAGLEIGASGSAHLVNATVLGNGVGVRAFGSVDVRNTIVTRNRIGLTASEPSLVASRYNDVFGNRDAELENVASGIGDVSVGVRFVGQGAEAVAEPLTEVLDARLAREQPSTDRGDPADGFELEPSPSGGRINMGAFGNTPFAELSASPPAPIGVPSDMAGRAAVPLPVAPPGAPAGGSSSARSGATASQSGSACSVAPVPASPASAASALGLLGALAIFASWRRCRPRRG